MSSKAESRVYLEFVGGSAAKFYAAVIEAGDDGTWGVAFNYGRIGFPRGWAGRTRTAFDAYLVGLGFDTVTLIVGRPPADLEAANGIAAEHLAFCPDNIFQGVGSIQEYAPMLVDAHRWDFWWD